MNLSLDEIKEIISWARNEGVVRMSIGPEGEISVEMLPKPQPVVRQPQQFVQKTSREQLLDELKEFG